MENILAFFSNPYIIRIVVAILCGSAIGLEREYRNKAAGFRTVVLICFGSAVFTVISVMLPGESDDRIAANIVTGIGFLGAGVIFKGKLSVMGLTTAAVIWATAAVGMMAGMGELQIAGFLTACMVLILAVFHKIEIVLTIFNINKTIYINFEEASMEQLYAFEKLAKECRISYKRKLIEKDCGAASAVYDLSGSLKSLHTLNEKMLSIAAIKSFSYS
ncbi:MgtC/SapB family protein [Sphingobacteriaceae bacterium WQ 2009]|uniref:MgtC/SapB family protein n=1 Tax=Rhinopithecimicrobium faecis TaxID=2820698 RepID=A0A8T4H7T2_9SPHI|nr:MgtC/SapB family protein [Sphingobacteriaceae bacterium WQ 2009]